ncbi:hypothetical protein BH23ACT10_BH23ACT10_20890 [soil metagenome]
MFPGRSRDGESNPGPAHDERAPAWSRPCTETVTTGSHWSPFVATASRFRGRHRSVQVAAGSHWWRLVFNLACHHRVTLLTVRPRLARQPKRVPAELLLLAEGGGRCPAGVSNAAAIRLEADTEASWYSESGRLDAVSCFSLNTPPLPCGKTRRCAEADLKSGLPPGAMGEQLAGHLPAQRAGPGAEPVGVRRRAGDRPSARTHRRSSGGSSRDLVLDLGGEHHACHPRGSSTLAISTSAVLMAYELGKRTRRPRTAEPSPRLRLPRTSRQLRRSRRRRSRCLSASSPSRHAAGLPQFTRSRDRCL